MKPTEIPLHPATELPNIVREQHYLRGLIYEIMVARLNRIIRDATEKHQAVCGGRGSGGEPVQLLVAAQGSPKRRRSAAPHSHTASEEGT